MPLKWPVALCVMTLIAGPVMPAPAAAGELRLRRAVLTLGGVGTFEYEADIGPDGVAALTVRRGDVDDVLKSLVVVDSHATVAGLELPGPDGSTAAFAALPFGPPALADPLALLNGLRGVPMEVRDASGREIVLSGRLLGALRSREAAAGAKEGLERTRVTLLTDSGLRQFVLEDVGAVRVTDPALQQRIDNALATLRGQAADDRREIRLRLTGAQGTVRVAVVTATPLWKATYRLVLPGRGTAETPATARLQGWAVLENLSATDWTDVAVSLQSGNPVTFRQNLYQPLLVERPTVPVAAPSRIVPTVDQAAIPAASPAPAPPMPMPLGAMRMAAPVGAAMAAPSVTATASEGLAATTFALPNPVSLPTGATASVPFLDRTVPAEPLDLLQFQAVHPLAAVRLTNNTDSGLPAGAVATFDGGDFAGDALLPVLQTGERRLLTFAEDGAITAIWQQADAQDVTGLTVAGGIAHLTRRQRGTTTIDLQSTAPEPRTVLIALPREPDATLTATGAETADTTADSTRLRAVLQPGEHRTVIAVSDRPLGEDIAITDNPDALLQLRNASALSQAARAAIDRIAALQLQGSARAAERDRLQQRQQEIITGEERLRANLAAVPTGDPLHTRLLRQLDESETTLQSLAGELDRANVAAQQAHDALAAAIASLSIR